MEQAEEANGKAFDHVLLLRGWKAVGWVNYKNWLSLEVATTEEILRVEVLEAAGQPSMS